MSDELMQTHSTGCHAFGHRHYECALVEIERLRAEACTADQVVRALQVSTKYLTTELAALRKRVEEAPVAEWEAYRYNEVPEHLIGKRVALVVLGEG